MTKKIILLLCLFQIAVLPARADTVHLKNGDLKKGMVVEEYMDRIIFSTVDGEVEIMKDLIEKVSYDDPEMNLMSLGDEAFDRGSYKQAYKYYTLALEINPDLAALRKKRDHAGLLVYKEKEMSRRGMVEKRAMLESRSEPVFEKTDPAESLKEKLGIILVRTKDGNFRLGAVLGDSPFKKAGFMAGDYIVSVWSRLASYLTLKDISELLLSKDQHIIDLTFKRRLEFRKQAGAALGAGFVMKWDGMTAESVEDGGVLGRAGLKEGDILVAVNGESIRYTKMAEVLKTLDGCEKAGISVHRRATVFRLE